MTPAEPPILLCADKIATIADVRQTLEHAGFEPHCQLLTERVSSNGAAALVLVDGGARPEDALRLCARLRGDLNENTTRPGSASISDSFVPLLYITADTSPGVRRASLESGADAYLLRPFDPAELLAQVRALLRLKERHDALRVRTSELQRANKRLHAAHLQHDLELDLARRLQQSFLPQSLPALPGVRFAVKYKPCGRVGGDFYDAFRLDEHHVGFYIADAMGHGVPASLLTVFVKKGVKPKEVFGQQYRLLSPTEVIKRLKKDLMEEALSEDPFITIAYVLYYHPH